MLLVALTLSLLTSPGRSNEMDRDEAARVAVAAFFMALAKGVSISKALADLYEAGREDGREAVLDDPQSYEMVGIA